MLIRCPDCNREVSSLAVSCPQCGRPTATLPPNRRFLLTSYDSIVDASSGLEWYLPKEDRNTGRDLAKLELKLCNTIGPGGHLNWRFPSIAELATLYQKGVGTRNMDPVFRTTGWVFWADLRAESEYFWAFDFQKGTGIKDLDVILGDRLVSETRAFLVRSRK